MSYFDVENFIKRWLLDLTIGKSVAAFILNFEKYYRACVLLICMIVKLSIH
jgi:hypothetical protein